MDRLKRLFPGVGLCVALAAAARAVETLEAQMLGHAYFDAIVMAILFGIALRAVWTPANLMDDGIRFSAQTLLEIAIVMLGLSVSSRALATANLSLGVTMVVVVVLGCLSSYAIGRFFGLNHNLAILIACGNSICGNTAIVAIAPVLGANKDEIGASVTFTAVLGVAVVLLLPPFTGLIRYNNIQAGVFAGLTVYSVTQVVAATAPLGTISVQVGTLVKLARMLMLGPVAFTLSLLGRKANAERLSPTSLTVLAPWFMLGFVATISLRATGIVPTPLVAWIGELADAMVTVTMAALGLGVDIRQLMRAGSRAACVVCLSLLAMAGLSCVTMRLMHIE